MMPCEQILKLSSTDYINKYTQAHGDNTLERVNAIYQYGNCYSQNLDNIQAKMNESGHHPLMGANAQFHNFESALNNFTDTALGFCSPDGSLKRVTAAYATLYQKQFRNLFYQQYLPKGKVPAADSKAISAAQAKLEDLIKHLPERQVAAATKAFTAYYDAAVKDLNLPAQPVYEYAIMLLQPPADKPYSPPPF
jgi:hypothetical protein